MGVMKWRIARYAGAAALAVVLVVASDTGALAAAGWSAVKPLPTATAGLAASLGPDGQIYAVGGASPSSGGITNAVEAYRTVPDPEAAVTDQPQGPAWRTMPSMPTARRALGVATGGDGRIYAVGGLVTAGPCAVNPTNVVEAYDTKSRSWSTVAPMPTTRGWLAVVAGLDGRIYAIGGANFSGPTPCFSGAVSLNTVEAFDPTSGSWTTLAPMPRARSVLAAATGLDGRIYVMGGDEPGSGDAVGTLEAYDPSTNTWAELAPMLTPRDTLAAATGPDGLIYAIGGANGAGTVIYDTVEAYNPGTDTWSTMPSMPTARHGLAASIGRDKRIYAIGGNTGFTGPTNVVEAYSVS